MLTAFNYYEPEEENRIRKEIKDSELFRKELDIARRFTELHQDRNMVKNEKYRGNVCPICKGNDLSLFYVKWGVSYFRCNSCYSIFADIEKKTEEIYQKCPEMMEFRVSGEYQQRACENRKQMWEELLDWLRFRTYRYLGKNKELSVIDYGTRYEGLSEQISMSDLCLTYELRNSILKEEEIPLTRDIHKSDIILCLDYIQHEIDPIGFLKEIKQNLKSDGLLFLSMRAGSGFDILTLRENNRNVFPYEHIMLPSKEGLKIMLEKAGYEMLEITTPGTFDWNYVKTNSAAISENEFFLKYFMDTATPHMEAEFQRFLQQSGMSSYAQVVARPN